MWIVTDIHGCYYTLQRLLAKCAAERPGERLTFLGDLIDHGPHSRKVVEFAMENVVPTVRANHDDLCLAYSAHRKRGYRAKCSSYYDRDVWLYNGGEATLTNWPTFRATENDGVPFRDGEYIPEEVLDWMAALPPYLIPDEPADENGLKLLCSHTGYGLEADSDTSGGWYRALWGRMHEDGEFPKDEYYRVLGHTSVKTPLITERWANIDTSAAHADRGGGIMTAFHWPTKTVVQQAYDESVIDSAVEVREGRLYPKVIL